MFLFVRLFIFIVLVAGCAAPVTAPPSSDTSYLPELGGVGNNLNTSSIPIGRISEGAGGSYSKRLHRIAFWVFAANAEFCPAIAPDIGATLVPAVDVPAAQSYFSERLWTASSFPRDGFYALHIVPGSPAWQGGMRLGDRILEINGVSVPPSGDGLGRLLAALQLDNDSRFTVLRKGARKNLTIRPVSLCAYPVFIKKDSSPNAYTDGKQLVFHTGLFSLASTDSELALVVSHELAHIVLSHINKQRSNIGVGVLGGIIADSVVSGALGVSTEGAFTQIGVDIGRHIYSKAFESEADYVGMYFLARSGFPTSGVERFWDKMASRSNRESSFSRTHPRYDERKDLIERTHREIETKKHNKLPLRPNLKE